MIAAPPRVYYFVNGINPSEAILRAKDLACAAGGDALLFLDKAVVRLGPDTPMGQALALQREARRAFNSGASICTFSRRTRKNAEKELDAALDFALDTIAHVNAATVRFLFDSREIDLAPGMSKSEALQAYRSANICEEIRRDR